MKKRIVKKRDFGKSRSIEELPVESLSHFGDISDIVPFDSQNIVPDKVTEFKFQDVHKLTKYVKKVQKRIEREMRITFLSPALKMGYDLFDRVMQMTGRQKKGLQDLFDQELEYTREISSLLLGLNNATEMSRVTIGGYLDDLDDRVELIDTRAEPYVRTAIKSHKQYKHGRDKYVSLAERDPERSRMRKQVRHLESVLHDDAMRVIVGEDIRNTTRGIYEKVNRLAATTTYASDFALRLGVKYTIVSEFLARISPSIVLVRDIQSHEQELLDLVQQLGITLKQAYQIESDFENSRLIKDAYESMPSLPSGKNNAQIVDYVNNNLDDPRKLLV